MQALLATILESVVGGQAAGTCPVSNEMHEPLTIAPLVDGGKVFTLAPNESGAVPAGRFLAVQKAASGGSDDGDCQPGRSFSVKRDSRWTFMNRPSVQRR